MSKDKLTKDHIETFTKSLVEEPRFQLDIDSVCYGCHYYAGEDICNTPQPCIEGSMNGYRMEG
jgi:hypothetical protein